jgi:flagellar motor switch protein FliM
VTRHAAVGAAALARQAAALAEVLGAPPRLLLGTVGVVPLADLVALLGTPPRALVVLERDGHRAVLDIDPPFARELCGRVLGTAEPALPPRALTATEEGVLELLVLTLLAAGDGRVRLVTITQDPARVTDAFPDPWVVVAPVAVTIGDRRGEVRLLLPESVLVAAPPPSLAVERLLDLEFVVAVELGRAPVPGAELAEVAPGDVVLLDSLRASPGAGGPATLRAGRLVVPVVLAPDGSATVTEPLIWEPWKGSHALPRWNPPGTARRVPTRLAEGVPMPDPIVPPVGAERLAGVAIEVTAELGRVTLTGRDLAALGPGVVVQLGRPLGGPVDLLAGGRLLASGELVDVDGEVGVRVTELAG